MVILSAPGGRFRPALRSLAEPPVGGHSRLLVPTGACDPGELRAAVNALSARAPAAQTAGATAQAVSLKDRNGR
jgi:hypothetical protein